MSRAEAVDSPRRALAPSGDRPVLRLRAELHRRRERGARSWPGWRRSCRCGSCGSRPAGRCRPASSSAPCSARCTGSATGSSRASATTSRRGARHDVAVAAEPFPPVLARLVAQIERRVRDGFPPRAVPRRWHLNTCLVNFYGDRLDGDRVDRCRTRRRASRLRARPGRLAVARRARAVPVRAARRARRPAGAHPVARRRLAAGVRRAALEGRPAAPRPARRRQATRSICRRRSRGFAPAGSTSRSATCPTSTSCRSPSLPPAPAMTSATTSRRSPGSSAFFADGARQRTIRPSCGSPISPHGHPAAAP